MKEHSAYLQQVFGPDALQINILNRTHTLYGEVNQKHVVPLEHVDYGNDGMACLYITDKHTSGHFTGPKTFPAYRMLELGALIGGRVSRIENASFHKIVTPGDTLKAFLDPNKEMCIIRKNNGEVQQVAQARMTFNEEGLLPHQLGVVLELAAQTMLANMAHSKPEMQDVYPVLLNIGAINVHNPYTTTYFSALPNTMEQLDDNMFKASAEIRSDSDSIMATVEDMVFKLANQRRIQLYDSLGRT